MNSPKSFSPFLVTVNAGERQFESVPGRSLLHSGLMAGIAIPYQCSNGTCGDCRAKILSGEVELVERHDYVLTEVEKLAGICLLCANSAASDISLEIIRGNTAIDIPQQLLVAKLDHIENLTAVAIVRFKFSRGKALRFLPGQAVELSFASGYHCVLPIASCPCNSRFLDFHIARHSCDIESTNSVLVEIEKLKPLDKVTITGPSGTLTLSEELKHPLLFITSGIEFGRVQGLIEQVFDLDAGIECCLLWQSTEKIDHYRHNLCRAWADAFDEFTYIPMQAQVDVVSTLSRLWPVDLKLADIYISGYDDSLNLALIEAGATIEHMWQLR